MRTKTRRFWLFDILFVAGMVLPLLAGITLKILFTPPQNGIEIRGALVYLTLPMPFFAWPITEAVVNLCLSLCALVCLCLFLTHGIRARVHTRRQIVAEWIVERVQSMTRENMGEHFLTFSPFVGAILGLSGLCGLLSLLGIYAPTRDLSIVAGWAILVFALITYYKTRAGALVYVESFGKPLMLAPLNVVGELATPVSMAFRQYGNVLAGAVIMQLVSYGLQGLSEWVFGFLPFGLARAGILRVGIPAILSIYFDLFSTLLQAYIFAMLTMLYISRGYPQREVERRERRRREREKRINS